MRVLKASFVRTVGERDRIYVTRTDGTTATWAFPTYGEALPHDLVHLVVESAFGLADGFWGRVDAGVDPARVMAEANRRGGAQKYAALGADQAGLMRAEALANARWLEPAAAGERRRQVEAACAAAGVAAPVAADATFDDVPLVLAALTARWRGLGPKGALDLVFHRDAPTRAFAGMGRAPRC